MLVTLQHHIRWSLNPFHAGGISKVGEVHSSAEEVIAVFRNIKERSEVEVRQIQIRPVGTHKSTIAKVGHAHIPLFRLALCDVRNQEASRTMPSPRPPNGNMVLLLFCAIAMFGTLF